jgi:hypothetical protein
MGGLVWGLVSVLAGQVLVGVVVFAWSAYVVPGWAQALQRRQARMPELLRMDASGVTVHHPGRHSSAAWSVGWPQVRACSVREVGLPERFWEDLGRATKVLTIEVLDHREVDGPDNHRQRLLGWALLTGSTPSRTRLQLLLARLELDAVGRVAAWLAEHQPAAGLDIEVSAAGKTPSGWVPSRVGILVPDQALADELLERLDDLGLRTVVVADSPVEALAEGLRDCTAVIAVDTDPDVLSEGAGRAGLDRVVWAVIEVADASVLVRPERAWTTLDLAPLETESQHAAGPEVGDLAATLVGLLTDRTSLGRQWRLGDDGVPVAASMPA